MPETQSASRPSPERTLEGHNAGDDIGTNALGARNDPLVSVQQPFQGAVVTNTQLGWIAAYQVGKESEVARREGRVAGRLWDTSTRVR